MQFNTPLIKVTCSLVLAVMAGFWSGTEVAVLGVPLVEIYGLIGELFLNALSLVVVPLVASSIILGAARMGEQESLGSLGLKAFGYFFFTTALAVMVGYGVVTAFYPGGIQTPYAAGEANLRGASALELSGLQQASQESAFIKFKVLLLKILPSNILFVASQGQMLSLILFCLLFGYYCMKIEAHASGVMINFWKGLFQIMMRMTTLFMKALPIGVFGLVAKVAASSGLEAFSSVAWFLAAAMLALGLYALVVLPLLLKYGARVSPRAFFGAISPALLTAFSTSSSAASLPVALDCLERRVGVSNRIAGFTLPLGTAVSLSGSAMYECLVVLFIAQVYGIHLTFATQVLIIIMAILTSFGLAGIPSACLIAILVILQTVGLPVEGLGLILAVERPLDMVRTAINVLGNSTCTVLVAKSEGETELLTSSITPSQMESS